MMENPGLSCHSVSVPHEFYICDTAFLVTLVHIINHIYLSRESFSIVFLYISLYLCNKVELNIDLFKEIH